MSVEVTYQRKCDRCSEDIGKPFQDEESERGEPILSLEAPGLGLSLTTMRDICDECKGVLPALLMQVVSAKVTKAKQKKDKGET